ncbi:MAG: TIGR03087 family PEP-CTERM/XrtA system glycosyltransferase, partial [Arenicellales bacterium]
FLCHRLPFPPNKGDKIRSFNILKFLSARHKVFLACPIDDGADLAFLPELRSYTQGFALQRIVPRWKKLSALTGLLERASISVRYFYSQKLQREIDQLIALRGFDAYFCYSSPMAEYLFRSRKAQSITPSTLVMDLIDIDSYKWQQYAARSPLWQSWIYRYEAKHLAIYEKRIADGFDRLLVVSDQERSHFPGGAPDNLFAMSNGVDLEYFFPRNACGKEGEGLALVFTGVMDYWPNVEGVKWFVEKVFPRIQALKPTVKLYIVGSRPTGEVIGLGRTPGVLVTGFVEDVRAYLAEAAVCIVPLRIARGIQNKVLEAMAMGKAVVATSQALEGIRASAGKDLLVGDSEEGFAEAVLRLLRDPDGAREMGKSARACMEKHYSWDSNLAFLDEILPSASRGLENRAARAGS